MGKSTEIGNACRPSKARPWDLDGKRTEVGMCLFVHRKQLGKRTELGLPIRPSKARSWD